MLTSLGRSASVDMGRSLRTSRPVYNRYPHRERCGSTRQPRINDFENHRQLGHRETDLAAVGLRPDKMPARQSLREQP